MVVTVDRDLDEVPANICFDRVVLEGNRSLAITYQKDKVNAGEVLALVEDFPAAVPAGLLLFAVLIAGLYAWTRGRARDGLPADEIQADVEGALR